MNGFYYENEAGLDKDTIHDAILRSLPNPLPRKTLLIPPDITRMHSGVWSLTRELYQILSQDNQCDILPAIGTHFPMSREEQITLFGDEIPSERFLVHNWRTEVVKLGIVPAELVRTLSEGLMDQDIDVEINHLLVDGGYDWIVSLGQVVPHEVVGMSNYTKNLVVGCGGSNMINASHMLGAFYGIERILGRDRTPVRAVFDYAEEKFLKSLPVTYMLTVTTAPNDSVRLHGLYIGRDRELFERAVACSQHHNITMLDHQIQTCVAYLDPREFRSTWIGNKAVYRSRKAMADGGNLIVLASGIERFGEDDQNDLLIRKYGYCGREQVLKYIPTEEPLQKNLSVAAHLIHGSSDGRFNIIYATKPSLKEEIEGVGYLWADLDEMQKRYADLKPGWNGSGDEEVFYISNPALGLWAVEGLL